MRYWRERRGLSRRACAELLGYSEGWLQKIEQGQRRLDRLPVLTELARVLRVPVAELQGSDTSTELDEVGRRLNWLSTPNVSSETLQHLETLTAGYPREYEETDAATVYPEVLAQRRWVQELLDGQQPPAQRSHLFRLAGQLSALLGYLAFDRGDERAAQLYCREAFSLAQAVDDGGLMAWVRGTQSFIAYYRGRDQQALDLARDGQRHAAGGPQTIRLAIGGEARALGRLGDRAGVDEAVGRAFAARERLADDVEVSDFLSFGAFSTSRIAGNAASAYLALGAVDKTGHYAELGMPIFDEHGARASQALTRVDLAMALVQSDSPEPERAGSVMAEALRIGSGLRSEVVSRRAEQFLVTTRRYRSVPEIASVVHQAREWATAR